MAKAFSAIVILVLAGCSTAPYRPDPVSPCAAGEASYACQVERYQNVNVN